MSHNLQAFFEKENAEECTEHILEIEESSGHARLLLTQLAELRHDSRLCDVILVAQDTRIPAHRVVLAASSDYFKAMFSHEMAESQEVEIMDIEGSTLDALVEYFYSGRIIISRMNVLSILPACCLLQLIEVKEYCCRFLKEELHPQNCFEICAFADTYSCRKLLSYSYQYISDHFHEVAHTEEFLLLPAEQVMGLLSNEKLRVISEDEVFDAIMQWVRFDQTRDRLIPQGLCSSLLWTSFYDVVGLQLMVKVWLPFCRPEFRVDTVSGEALVMEDVTCRRFVEEAKKYQPLQLPTPVRADTQPLRTRPRAIAYNEVLYAVGGLCGGAALDSVERLDREKPYPSWQRHDPREPYPLWQSVASMTKKRYDPATNEWSNDVDSMLRRREDFGLAALDGFLYAVGGFDVLKEPLDIIERYDVRRNAWDFETSLISCRTKLALSVLNGCLYAVGGFDGNACLISVERLDPREGKWQLVRPMSTPRSSLGTAVLDGNLYAAGGYCGSLGLSSVEKYDPRADEWTAVAAMTRKKSAIRLAVVNKRMYAVGGGDLVTHHYPHYIVEVYVPEADQWSFHSFLNDERYSAGVGVIRMP